MFCKWCGLESETGDVCSWCHEPFTTAVAPPPADSAPTSEPAPPSEARAASPTIAGPVPLSDYDDDLAPTPFTPLAPTAPPPRPRDPAAPPASRPVSQPPVGDPPAATPGYRPAAPPADRPDLQAIPIKRPGTGGSPPIVPIARPAVTSPPPAGGSAPAPPPRILPVTPEPATGPPLSPVNRAPQSEPPSEPAAAPARPQPLGEIEDEEPQIGAAPISAAARDESISRPGTRPGAQPQPLAGATATATRPGGRVYCRHCGMESEISDTCSWCHKDLRNLPPPKPIEALKRGAPVKKGPHRHEVKPATPAAAEGNGNGAAVPSLGSFTAQKSRYYPDKVYDPVSGAHYDADTGAAEAPLPMGEDQDEELEPVYPLNQLAVNVALLVGIAFIGALAARSRPDLYLTLLGVTNFFAGMSMPLLRTVPFGEDDSSDVGAVIGLTLILGPFVGSILYFFYCFVKQDFSPAMVGVFVSYLALRFTLDGVLGIPIARMMPWSEFTPETIGAQIMPFVTIAGWYAAGMFHKPDE